MVNQDLWLFVGHAEPMHDVLYEFHCLFCTVFDQRFIFNPLCKFVDCHKYVFEASFCFFEWSYLIQPLAWEWPSWWYAYQIMSGHMWLSGKHLAILACFDELFCIFECYWPIEPGSECFADQCPRGCMISTTSWVDFIEDFLSFICWNTSRWCYSFV